MEDFSAPSFSLGFDVDIADLTTDGEDEEEEADHDPSRPSTDKWMGDEDSIPNSSVQQVEEEFDVTITLDKAQEEDAPVRSLKRLRRGPTPSPLAAVATPRLPVDDIDLIHESDPLANVYDEIEEFSSPDEPHRFTDDYPSTQSHITCNSAKFSLLHRGFLKDNLDGKQVSTKVAPTSTGASISTKHEANNLRAPFPRLTISPIRKINLLDSDSDDCPTNKNDYKKNEGADVSLKKEKYFHEKSSASEGPSNFSARKCEKESFWKDFSPKKSRKFETPALDEFCEEYFISARDQKENRPNGETKSYGFRSSRGLDTDDVIDGYDHLNPCKNINDKVCISLDLSSPHPPAYRYFYHSDPRIQTLVRQRLPHFFPLGTKNDSEAQQFGTTTIDYMSQFNPTPSSRKAHVVPEKVSRSNSSKKQNKQNFDNVIETTDNWVNPRSKAAIPKDAGKRRVSADILQSGQWFTDPDGRKVYVSKNGEQSTGRTAYMKYKKESSGFRKPKRKPAAKKSRKSK